LLIVGSVFMFPRLEEQPMVNPLVALVGSGFVVGFLWIAVRKYLDAAHARPSHSLDTLVGQIGEAKTKVDEQGSVQVNGELWSARSEGVIPAGSTIRVVRREGFILIVEKSS
jgi:membrane-bound serine protease (ClpP class)